MFKWDDLFFKKFEIIECDTYISCYFMELSKMKVAYVQFLTYFLGFLDNIEN